MRPFLLIAQHEGMGRATIEPHVEHVGDHFVVVDLVGVAEVTGSSARLVPGVGAFFLEALGDAVIDRFVLEDFVGRLVDEDGDRHAPGALA